MIHFYLAHTNADCVDYTLDVEICVLKPVTLQPPGSSTKPRTPQIRDVSPLGFDIHTRMRKATPSGGLIDIIYIIGYFIGYSSERNSA